MRIGVIVGSLSSTSINRKVANALKAYAPEGVEFVDIAIADLPLYSPDFDADYPAVAKELKATIEGADAIIIATPEYSRSLPGALKNALDWAARPWGTNSFSGKPVAILGASVGPIGTAVAQQHLRTVLAHFNTYTMGQPETFLRISADSFGPNGEVADDALAALLEGYMAAAIAHFEHFAA